MSYDIVFKIRVAGVKEGDPWVTLGEQNANITWNLGEMIRACTGLEWKNETDNGLVKDIMPAINEGLLELKYRPEKYRQYEAPNGYGTIEGCKQFFQDVFDDWENLRERYGDDIANAASFWIE